MTDDAYVGLSEDEARKTFAEEDRRLILNVTTVRMTQERVLTLTAALSNTALACHFE